MAGVGPLSLALPRPHQLPPPPPPLADLACRVCWEFVERNLLCPVVVLGVATTTGSSVGWLLDPIDDAELARLLTRLRDADFPGHGIESYVVAHHMTLTSNLPSDEVHEVVFVSVVDRTAQATWVRRVIREGDLHEPRLGEPEPWFPGTSGLGLALELLTTTHPQG